MKKQPVLACMACALMLALAVTLFFTTASFANPPDSSAEASERCFDDGVDSDFDEYTDCQDQDCLGSTGTNGEVCEFPGETTCDDADCADDSTFTTPSRARRQARSTVDR